MSSEPFPNTLDVRKAAARGVDVSGVLKPLDLPRFAGLLADDSGSIKADMTFLKDEESRPLIRLSFEAAVAVICQRCLKPMPLEFGGENILGVVWTDEQARHMPRHLEAVIIPEEEGNLWGIVEEELILALPPYSYHDTEDCLNILSEYSGPAPDEEQGEKKPNPFDVLAQLKQDT